MDAPVLEFEQQAMGRRSLDALDWLLNRAGGGFMLASASFLLAYTVCIAEQNMERGNKKYGTQ